MDYNKYDNIFECSDEHLLSEATEIYENWVDPHFVKINMKKSFISIMYILATILQ